MRILILLTFFSLLIMPQNNEKGKDVYLNNRADYICKQIAESKIPIENLGPRGAFTLVTKRGLENANASAKHTRKLEKQGVSDRERSLYSGYVDIYLLQACPSYHRYFKVVNRRFVDNKLQKERFFEVTNFIRDVLQAQTISEIENYLEIDNLTTNTKRLKSHKNGLQEISWTSSLIVYSPTRKPTEFVLELIDLQDTKHFFELKLSYKNERDSKISSLVINEYTKENPKQDTFDSLELIEEIPKNRD